MLKLPKSHERTFDQVEYSRAINKLKSSYYVLSNEKIDEIHKLSPDIQTNESYYNMTFDQARYAESIRNLKNAYYTLTNESIERVKELTKSI
jgi:hypothetical protein